MSTNALCFAGSSSGIVLARFGCVVGAACVGAAGGYTGCIGADSAAGASVIGPRGLGPSTNAVHQG